MKINLLVFALFSLATFTSKTSIAQDFQGQAYYMSKSSFDFGTWGATMSESQKKQVMARLKNRLEKTYILSFNKTESTFNEEDKLDAISGATDSWGKNFTPGELYKDVKENEIIQDQEFYGKRFLVKDRILDLKWVMGKETKTIGDYTCFKATTSIPTSDLNWYNFSWSEARNNDQDSTDEVPEIAMTTIEAWYTPQIPVSHGPAEYWGLPGLILEVSAGDTTMLCTKIILNPEEKIEIEAPSKGKEISKKDYKETIIAKMQEFRENRMGRRQN